MGLGRRICSGAKFNSRGQAHRPSAGFHLGEGQRSRLGNFHHSRITFRFCSLQESGVHFMIGLAIQILCDA